MRTKTLISAVLLGVSGAALAQVAGAPIEQKTGNQTAGNDLLPATDGSRSNTAAAADNTAIPDNAVDRAK